MSDRDWYVIGPSVVLRGRERGLPVTLGVTAMDGETAEVTLEADANGTVLVRTGLSGRRGIETLRLATRLVWAVRPDTSGVRLRLSGRPPSGEAASLLEIDGFTLEPSGDWARGAEPFVRPSASKAVGMEGVYADPFTVPWNFVPREHDVIDRALTALGGQPRGACILDLGCGSGKNATLLEDLGCDVHGIDISGLAVRRCRELVRRPANFVAGSAADLPWPDATFDLVLDVGGVHCMTESERAPALAEAGRVLKPGGAIVSRLFRTQTADWASRQPWRATSFGFEPAGARALFATDFDLIMVETTPDTVYVTGRRTP